MENWGCEPVNLATATDYTQEIARRLYETVSFLETRRYACGVPPQA